MPGLKCFVFAAEGMGVNAALDSLPYVTRISVTDQVLTSVIFTFFKRQNYTSPTILHDESNVFFFLLGRIMDTLMRDTAPDLYYETRFVRIKSEEITRPKLRDILKDQIFRSRGNILSGFHYALYLDWNF